MLLFVKIVITSKWRPSAFKEFVNDGGHRKQSSPQGHSQSHNSQYVLLNTGLNAAINIKCFQFQLFRYLKNCLATFGIHHNYKLNLSLFCNKTKPLLRKILFKLRMTFIVAGSKIELRKLSDSSLENYFNYPFSLTNLCWNLCRNIVCLRKADWWRRWASQKTSWFQITLILSLNSVLHFYVLIKALKS